MKINILVAILLVAIQITQAEDTTYCEVNQQYSNTRLLTSVQEKQYYYLDKYIKGYNLSYELAFADLAEDHPAINNYKIYQGVSEEFDRLQHDDFKIFIAQDDIIKESGSTMFVALAENLEGRYIAKFGTGDVETTPFYIKTIQLPEDSAVTCFDITMINADVAVVDCVKDHSGPLKHPFMNMFYIVSQNGDHAEEYQEIADNWNYVNPFGRKNRLYDISHDGLIQKYIIQGIPFDLDEGDVTDSYLNVFRYVADDPEQFHNGRLQINAPITAQSLGIIGKFQLADFDVLGDFIYVLDNRQGVYFFQYKHNKILNLKSHLNESFNSVLRWAISVNYDGSIVQMLVAESSQIVEYQMIHLDDGPQYLQTYRIENEIIGTCELQSNAEFIALRQGRLLSIYDKGQMNIDLLKGVVENVESFTLFYSNTIMVYNTNEISNYIVQKPTLRISPHTEENEFKVILTATSKNFSTTETCNIELVNHIIAEPASKAYYDTNFPDELEWTDSQSGYTSIPLEKHFVGPNLRYDVQVIPDDIPEQQEDQSKFLGQDEKNSDEDLNIILYNEPRTVQFDFGFGDITEDVEHVWQWTLIVPFLNDSSENFYTIHQNTENNVLIYKCMPSLLSWGVVDCEQHVSEIPFKAPVQAYGYGTWGQERETFAAVDSFIPSIVNFYHLIENEAEDIKPGDFYTSVDFNDIEEWGYGNKVISLELDNNTLYAIIEGKSSRFVTISSNISEVQHRERITDYDAVIWYKDIQHSWHPEQLTVSSAHRNVLFIKSRSNVYIISVENLTPYFIDVVMLYNEIGTYIYAGPHSLVIAEADTKIYDYSLVNLNYVSFDSEFTYQTYEYKFIDPFTVTSNHYSGLIYVLAHTVNKNDLQLLIYRSGVENIRTLYKVIELESEIDIDQNSVVNIAVGGVHEDYVFIQYNGKKKYVRSPGEPSIILIPFIQAKNEYVDFVPLGLHVYGWDGNYQSAHREITVVNSQTQVHLDVMKINEQLKDGLYANDKPHSEFILDTKEWYEGSVLGFDIACEPNPEACGKEITLKSMLHDKVDYDPFEYTDVIDLLNIYEHVLMLTRDDSNNFLVYQLSSDLDNTKKRVFGKIGIENDKYECTYITPVYDDIGEFHYLVALCYDVRISTWATYKVMGDLNAKEDNLSDDSEDFKYLTGIKDINRKQYQYFHDKLFVNYESDDAYAGIYVFDLEESESVQIGTETVEANKKVRVINKGSFLGDAPNLRITSFFVDYEELDHLLAREEQVYVKVIITDSPQGQSYPPYLRFISLKIKDNYAPDYIDSDSLDIRKFIQDSQLFINLSTHLLKIQIMDIHEEHDIVDSIDIVKYHGFLLTDNTAMYKIELVFTRNSSDSEKPLIFSPTRTKITEIFNNYGINVAYPQVELYQHCIALAYFNPSTKNVTIAIYEYIQLYQGKYGRFSRVDRNSNQKLKTSLKTANGLPLYTLKAGVKLESVFASIGLQFPPVSFILYENDKGQIGLLSEDLSYTDNLKAMEYTGDQMTLITDGNFKQQSVSFYAKSDFISPDTVQFKAKVDPHSFKPEDDKGGSGGLSGGIIALIVILVLAFVAVVGFFVYKKFFQGNSGAAAQPFLKPTGDSLSEAGYSMQEATKA